MSSMNAKFIHELIVVDQIINERRLDGYIIHSPHLLVRATSERRVPAMVATSGSPHSIHYILKVLCHC